MNNFFLIFGLLTVCITPKISLAQENIENRFSVLDLQSFTKSKESFSQNFGIPPNILRVYDPVFGVEIDKETAISNLHREDDQITMYGPDEKITKLAPSAINSKKIYVLYLIPTNRSMQSYEMGEFHLNYQWFLVLDNVPYYSPSGIKQKVAPVLGGKQNVSLNCKTNEYYRSGKKIRGEYYVLPDKRYAVNPKTTFGQWANTICDGKSEFFKKLKRGYF